MKNLLLIAVAGLAALAPISSANSFQGQGPDNRTCTFTLSPGTGTIEYDPFRETSTNLLEVMITVTRTNDVGGAHADTVDIYFRNTTDPELEGVMVIPTSVTGSGTAEGLNQDIFFDLTEMAPNIPLPLNTMSPPLPGVLRWAYSGNNVGSDIFTIMATVEIPLNSEFDASTMFFFDVEGGCNGTGGNPGGQYTGPLIVPGGIQLNITVLSALRATYVGSPLDFGEVGDLAVAGPPVSGEINVQSSDIYQVSMITLNDYRMTYPGGIVAQDLQSLDYQVDYLGQTGSRGVSWGTKQCVRAGVATGVRSPIVVTLLEGGDDEVPSPDYIDYIIITYTPQIDTPIGSACGS